MTAPTPLDLHSVNFRQAGRRGIAPQLSPGIVRI
jgi:hypothetical protein